MKIRGLVFTALLASVAMPAGAESVLGSVSGSSGPAYVSGVAGKMRIGHQSEMVVSGDVISTGEDAWSVLQLDRVGSIQLGAFTEVQVGRLGDLVELTLNSGALNYSLQAGESLMITVENTVLVAGRKEAGLVPTSTGAASSGIVALDGEQVVVHNTTGELQAMTAGGESVDVPQGELLAVEASAVDNGSITLAQVGQGIPSGSASGSLQVGGAPASSSSSGGYEKCRTSGGTRWRCLGPWGRAGVVFAGVVGGYFLYEEVIEDDPIEALPPASPF